MELVNDKNTNNIGGCLLHKFGLRRGALDHVHLAATNAEEAVNWSSKHFGGTPGSFNRGDADVVEYPTDRVFYGDLSIIFFEREPTGGSVGTGVDILVFLWPMLTR